MRWLIAVALVVMVAGCGSTGFFDGSWNLDQNGCDPDITFPNQVSLKQTGSTIIVDESFDIYKVTATGEEDNNALIGEVSEQFLLCLDPVGETDPDLCLQLCAGDAMDNDITFFCENGTGQCGPVTFSRVL